MDQQSELVYAHKKDVLKHGLRKKKGSMAVFTGSLPIFPIERHSSYYSLICRMVGACAIVCLLATPVPYQKAPTSIQSQQRLALGYCHRERCSTHFDAGWHAAISLSLWE